MHVAQKKAVFALLDAIEGQLNGLQAQLRYVKSIVLMDEEHGQEAPGAGAAKAPPTNMVTGSSYLSDDEEKQLEKQLEEERQLAMAREEAKIQAGWSQMRRIAEEETAPLVMP